jgi:hypothetical protein
MTCLYSINYRGQEIQHRGCYWVADDGFGNLIDVARVPYRAATEEETNLLGLPRNFQIATGPYSFVMSEWLINSPNH